MPCHLTNVAVTTGGKVAAARCWEEICRLLLFSSMSLPVMTAVLTSSPPQGGKWATNASCSASTKLSNVSQASRVSWLGIYWKAVLEQNMQAVVGA